MWLSDIDPSFRSSMGILGCLGDNAVMRQIRLRYEPNITNLTLMMSSLLTIDHNGQENYFSKRAWHSIS